MRAVPEEVRNNYHARLLFSYVIVFVGACSLVFLCSYLLLTSENGRFFGDHIAKVCTLLCFFTFFTFNILSACCVVLSFCVVTLFCGFMLCPYVLVVLTFSRSRHMFLCTALSSQASTLPVIKVFGNVTFDARSWTPSYANGTQVSPPAGVLFLRRLYAHMYERG